MKWESNKTPGVVEKLKILNKKLEEIITLVCSRDIKKVSTLKKLLELKTRTTEDIKS
ncbi:MAG: hypothetical protein AB1349_01650 [Elusimicrobiota bacterium]